MSKHSYAADELSMGDFFESLETDERPAVAAPPRKNPSFLLRCVGWLGELLITAGVVIGLFVVWQLYWTDFLANREQGAKIEVVTQDWKDPGPKIGTPRTDEPPAVEHVTEVGAVEGVMRIPAFGADYAHTIEYGTELEEVLDTGAFGHYHDTAYPGEVGNYSLAAHRQTYGAPMKNVSDLKTGDPIIVETKDSYLVYYVSDSYIVPPTDTGVILPVPNDPAAEATERILTITTCHPPFVSNERWIIHAKFDHWVDRNDGIPQEMAG